MLKLFIADDEQNIRDGLKFILDWESLGLRLCGEASTGKDAVRQIEDLIPDVVLLDIKMPGLTGLEVMEEVRRNFFRRGIQFPAFIILSGYSEFDYARKALNLGARAYILKPVDEDELERAVVSSCGQINRIRGLEETSRRSEESSVRNFLMNMLHSGNPPDTSEVEGSAFLSDAGSAEYICVLFSPSYCASGDPSALSRLADESFRFFSRVVLNISGGIVTVLRTSNSEAVGNSIARAARQHPERTFICRGGTGIGYGGILASYRDAISLVPVLFYMSGEPCVSRPFLQSAASSCPVVTSSPEEEYGSLIDSLLFCIETYNKERMETELEKLRNRMRIVTRPQEDTRRDLIYCLVELRGRLKKKYQERDITDGETFDVVPGILENRTFDESFFYLRKVVNSMLENFSFNTSDSVIVKVIAYVQSNYMSDLKLELLGDMFNCNSAYLGKRFRKYTGVQFNTYLDNLRIEESKRRLRETDLKVYQISKLVGYSNTDYFFMKFKKHTGITPREFKRRVEAGEEL